MTSCLNAQEQREFYYTIFGVKDGLSSAWINDVHVAKDGHVWIASNAGITIYNGYEFASISRVDGLVNVEVRKLAEDRHGNIWTCGRKGVSLIASDKLIRVSDKYVHDIVSDSHGNIWFNTYKDLWKVKAQNTKDSSQSTRSPELFSLPDSLGEIYSIEADDYEQIYLMCSAGLYKIHNARLQLISNSQGINYYKSLIAPLAKDRVLWTDGMSLVYESLAGQTSLYCDLGFGDLMHYDFFSFEDGPMILNNYNPFLLQKGALNRIEVSENTEIASFRCMDVDRYGNLWIGSAKGLILAEPLKFKQIPIPKSAPLAYSLLEVEDKILLGMNQGTVGQISNDSFSYHQPAKFLEAGEVEDILLDHHGRNWFLSFWRGIAIWDGKEIQNLFYGNLLIDEPDLICIFETKDHIVWVGGEAALYRIENNKTQLGLTSIERIKTHLIIYHIDSYQNKIYLGTNEGLYLEEEGNLNKVKLDGCPADSKILDFTFQKDTLFIATQGSGLIMARGISDSHFKKLDDFNGKNGLISNYLQDLEFDNSGRLWIASSSGLSSLSKNRRIIQNYTSQGISDRNFFDINLLKLGNGKMLCLQSQAAFSFDPEELDYSDENVPHGITSLKVNGESKEIAQFMRLKPSENSIEITYLRCNPANSESARYRYQLKGLHDGWSSVTPERMVHFDFLPAGSYEFQVQSCSAAGLWSEPASLKLQIAQVFWKSIWFQLLASLLIIGSSVYLLVRRNKIKSDKEKDKLQIQKLISELEAKSLRTQMNPHFIFNSLNAIQELVLTNETDEAYSYLSKFSGLLRQVMEHASTSKVRIKDEVSLLKKYLDLEKLRFDNKFEYQIAVENDIPDMYIPSLLVQPLVENAVKHGLTPSKHPTFLQINFSMHQKQLRCDVIDNGVGRKFKNAPKSKKRIHATEIVQDRISILNELCPDGANFEIIDLFTDQSEPAGTHVKLKISADWIKHIEDATGEN